MAQASPGTHPDRSTLRRDLSSRRTDPGGVRATHRSRRSRSQHRHRRSRSRGRRRRSRSRSRSRRKPSWSNGGADLGRHSPRWLDAGRSVRSTSSSTKVAARRSVEYARRGTQRSAPAATSRRLDQGGGFDERKVAADRTSGRAAVRRP